MPLPVDNGNWTVMLPGEDTMPALQPCDLWEMELGERACGWLGKENLPAPHKRYGSVVDRFLTRGQRKHRKISEYEEHLHYEWRRERSCLRKKPYGSRRQAWGASLDVQNSWGMRTWPYKCEFCDGWHLTKKRIKSRGAPDIRPKSLAIG